MQGKEIFAEKEISLLQSLVDHKVEFMVVGLGAAALQGAPVVTQDVDLWVKDLTSVEFNAALKSVGAIYVPPFGMNPPTLAGKGYELFDLVMSMSGLESFSEESENKILIDLEGVTVPVLSLERIIVSKTAAGRDKDKLVLPVLKDVLKTKNYLNK